jgi:hypothetical protein
MNLGEIYIYINTMIAKEVEGNTFNPITFNSVIKDTDIELFKDEWEMLERQAKAQGKPLYELLFSGSPLRTFTVTYSGGNTTLGSILLSTLTGFEQFIACTVINKNIYKDVEMVDIPEAIYRKSKLDGSILDESPIISLYNNRLQILPTNMGVEANSLEMIYLRMPVSPFFDYYIKNATGKAYYLPPGYYTEGDHESCTIKNSIGVQIDTLCTAPNNTANATPYNSASVELEWKTSYHGEFIKRLLRKAGIPIRDSFIIQASDGGPKQ